MKAVFKRLNKRLLRLTAGWIFLVLGLAGLVLPILQGILFLAIATVLLAPDIPIFKRLLEKLRERYPKIANRAEKISKKIE